MYICKSTSLFNPTVPVSSLLADNRRQSHKALDTPCFAAQSRRETCCDCGNKVFVSHMSRDQYDESLSLSSLYALSVGITSVQRCFMANGIALLYRLALRCVRRSEGTSSRTCDCSSCRLMGKHLESSDMLHSGDTMSASKVIATPFICENMCFSIFPKLCSGRAVAPATPQGAPGAAGRTPSARRS